MSNIIRVAYTLSFTPTEIAGGKHQFDNGTILYFQGVGVPLIKDITEVLNLTLETSYGSYKETFDRVANDDADVGGLLISPDVRTQTLGSSVTLLLPLDAETSNVYFRQPAVTLRPLVLRPFSTNLWSALVVLMFLVSIISRKNIKNRKCVDIGKVIIHSFELLICRHSVNCPSNQLPLYILSSKLIVSFLIIIVSAVYTSKMAWIFYLREEFVTKPADLIEYGYTLNAWSPIHIDRVFVDIETKNLATNRVNSTMYSDAISDVVGKSERDPRIALFSFSDGFYPQALYVLKYKEELCQVSVMKSLRQTSKSFFIRKDSRFRERLNQKILLFTQSGINYRYQLNFKQQFEFNCPLKETNFNPLGFNHLKHTFNPLIIGATIALLVCFLSRCRYTYKKRIRKANQIIIVEKNTGIINKPLRRYSCSLRTSKLSLPAEYDEVDK